ncbi:ArnT family glycosyltransferase [Flavobacteriaceae bacterium LMO-SS05]
MKYFLKYNKWVLLVLPVLLWFITYFIFHFDGLYGQDPYEYLRYTEALNRFISTGSNPGDYFWPLFYPIFGAALNSLIQHTALSLVFVSVVSLSVSALYLHKIVGLLFPSPNKLSVLYVILFYVLSPYVLKHGVVVMSDMLTTCFIVLAVYQFLKFRQELHIKYFYFFTIFSICTIMTRYAGAVIILPFLLIAVFQFIKYKNVLKHIPLLIGIVSILLIPHVAIRQSNYIGFLSHNWLQEWSFINFFKSSFTTVDGTSLNTFPNLFYAFSNLFHPRYVVTGIFFIPFLFQKKVWIKQKKSIGISVILYALFLAGIPFQNNRFLVLSFPLVLIVFYPAYIYLLQLNVTKKACYFLLFSILFSQLVLIYQAFKPLLERHQFELDLVEAVRPFQNQKLYSFDVDIALKGRGLTFDYQNLWKKKYSNFKPNDLILFHPTKFNKQWTGKNPIINWNNLNNHYNLSIVKECPEGWKLYKIDN